jgi:hypothetical protein
MILSSFMYRFFPAGRKTIHKGFEMHCYRKFCSILGSPVLGSSFSHKLDHAPRLR